MSANPALPSRTVASEEQLHAFYREDEQLTRITALLQSPGPLSQAQRGILKATIQEWRQSANQ